MPGNIHINRGPIPASLQPQWGIPSGDVGFGRPNNFARLFAGLSGGNTPSQHPPFFPPGLGGVMHAPPPDWIGRRRPLPPPPGLFARFHLPPPPFSGSDLGGPIIAPSGPDQFLLTRGQRLLSFANTQAPPDVTPSIIRPALGWGGNPSTSGVTYVTGFGHARDPLFTPPGLGQAVGLSAISSAPLPPSFGARSFNEGFPQV